MAMSDYNVTSDEINEGLFNFDQWNPANLHFVSYVKSPIQLRFLSTKTAIIGRALRHAIVDLFDNIEAHGQSDYVENETTVIGTEYRIYRSRRYRIKVKNEDAQLPLDSADGVQYCIGDSDNKIEFEISALAPTVFYQLREDVGIPNSEFRHSFATYHLKDFTNPGKSGSLMYKTADDKYILKTLRDYEARLLMQILPGYHLQLKQRATVFNRYIGLYSIRFPSWISTTEIYVAIMANAFTPSLRINEIFDLKGSTIKRKLTGNISVEKLHELKDMDFLDLYPAGIRIPSDIYRHLRQTIANDVKVLKKLNIVDFSLILGIRYLDITNHELMRGRSASGVAALFHINYNIAFMNLSQPLFDTSPIVQADPASVSDSYLKPLKMIRGEVDTDLYYNNDATARANLPIPGIINKSNQRIYIYLAIVDMLQTYDSFKYIEQTLKKITDRTRHLQYSVVEPDEYEKRMNKFLFEQVFVDAGDDFPWAITEVSKPVAQINGKPINNDNEHVPFKPVVRKRSQSAQRESQPSFFEFRL